MMANAEINQRSLFITELVLQVIKGAIEIKELSRVLNTNIFTQFMWKIVYSFHFKMVMKLNVRK